MDFLYLVNNFLYIETEQHMQILGIVKEKNKYELGLRPINTFLSNKGDSFVLQ